MDGGDHVERLSARATVVAFRKIFFVTAIGFAVAFASQARADVIVGPTLTQDTGNWNFSGIGFTSTNGQPLTSFTFENQGLADTISLFDASGNILDSISTPAGVTSYVANVDWALTAGQQYYLLETLDPTNGKFVPWGLAAPSDTDIALTQTGIFAEGGPPTFTGDPGAIVDNEYWSNFNDITTGGSAVAAVPEPGSLAIISAGLLGLAGLLRRRKANPA